jgi:hypothetical protein
MRGMNPEPFQGLRARERRNRGAINTADGIVGVILLLLIPLACYVLGPRTTATPLRLQKEPEVPKPPVDAAEVETRWTVARDVYRDTARNYLAAAATLQDGVLKDYHRQWAKRCMQTSISQLGDLARMIEENAESRNTFARYLAEMGALKREIETDLEKVNALDILKLDAPRASPEKEIPDQSK